MCWWKAGVVGDCLWRRDIVRTLLEMQQSGSQPAANMVACRGVVGVGVVGVLVERRLGVVLPGYATSGRRPAAKDVLCGGVGGLGCAGGEKAWHGPSLRYIK